MGSWNEGSEGISVPMSQYLLDFHLIGSYLKIVGGKEQCMEPLLATLWYGSSLFEGDFSVQNKA